MNWISVLQQLPPVGKMVLVLISYTDHANMQSIRSAQYTHETHYVQHIPTNWYNPNLNASYTNVTHWMPIYNHREEMQ